MVHIMIQNVLWKLFCSIWPNSTIKPILNPVSSGASNYFWVETPLFLLFGSDFSTVKLLDY